MNFLYNPTPPTVKKMERIYALKKDRYTFREIGEMIGHSTTYVKTLYKQYVVAILKETK